MTGERPYDQYRLSNDPALGRLPAHWAEPHLSHLAVLPITNGLGEGAADGDPAWPRYIRTTDIASLHSLKPDKRVTLRPDIAAPAMLSRLDLLMTAAGSLGTSHLFDGVEPSCYAGYLVRFRGDKSRVLPEYAAWWTESRHHLDQIALGAVRSTIDNFSAGKFRSMLIPLPPLHEQRAIARYLDREIAKIDLLIVEQAGLVDVLRERRTAVIEHAITRGLGEQTLTPSKVDWAPETPGDWAVGRLKYDTTMVGGGTPDTDIESYWLQPSDPAAISWVAIGDMSQRDEVNATRKAISSEALAVKRLAVGRPGTVLLAMYASVGEVAHLRIPAAWNQAILGLTPAPDRLDPRFLAYTLRVMKSYMLGEVRSNTQANLNARQVGDMWLPVPPLDEQRLIVEYLDEQTQIIDALMAEAEGIASVAKERRSALITAAVMGEIDVREKVA